MALLCLEDVLVKDALNVLSNHSYTKNKTKENKKKIPERQAPEPLLEKSWDILEAVHHSEAVPSTTTPRYPIIASRLFWMVLYWVMWNEAWPSFLLSGPE